MSEHLGQYHNVEGNDGLFDKAKKEYYVHSATTNADGRNMNYGPQSIYSNIYKDTSKRFHGVIYLLLRWKASVWKLVWHDLTIFLIVYTIVSLLYRFLLSSDPELNAWRESFELFCVYCQRFSKSIPISFLTGFYVSNVVKRWWDQFMSLPWPDQLALKLVAFLPGKDHFNKNLRRTVIRYVNLSNVLVLRLISQKVEHRFPSYQSLVDAKLLLPHEVDRLQRVDRITPHESSWTPLLWAMKLLAKARTEGKIKVEPPVFANLQSAFEKLESLNRKLLNYGWINFPLAYTQVATMAVFFYFVMAVFGRQFLLPSDHEEHDHIFKHSLIKYSSQKPFDNHSPDIFVPLFTILEFVLFMGWIKVAETLLNPFGDDDEDFNCNYLIDRNLQVSYLIVDQAEEDMEMTEDPFLEAGIDIPSDLPYHGSKTETFDDPGTPKSNHSNVLTSLGSFTKRFKANQGGQIKQLPESPLVVANNQPSSMQLLSVSTVHEAASGLQKKPNSEEDAKITEI